MQTYHVAFWNVENLFDVDGSPNRPPWLQKRLSKELQGWDEGMLQQKLQQLAHIIRQLNNGQGPDVLGVCEIENENVLERLIAAINLPARRYAVAHADTEDQRGIDVAFLFDRDRFEKKEQFSHHILKRTATRDLFQVTLQFKDQDGLELILIGNHWPARSGGLFESEPYRIIAGETLAYWHERITEIKGTNAAILVMGDFNDEPFNRSLTDYALSTYQRQKVLNAQSPRLYNLMWPFLGQRLGTHYFNNFASILDQFLISCGLMTTSASLSIAEHSVRVEQFPEMVSGGNYPSPIRFGRPASGFNPAGFSDHYPISLVLQAS